MRSVSPLMVAALVALPASIPARAQHAAARTAAANHPMVQQQKAMEAQFQQQQKAMEAQIKNEQKFMQQQQKAMQQQQAQQQKAMQQAAQQQQKAMQQQQHAAMQAAAHEQKAMALQPMKAPGLGNVGTGTGMATPNAAHHTSASKAAHHTTHVTPTVHHQITYWRTWPVSTHSHYSHLESLKRHLDSIAMKSVPTSSQKVGLKHALVNVIENSPHPASSHMQIFANHLADSIASRTTPAIDTRELALQLRVMVNNVHMTPVDLDAALVQHQALMLGSGVHPDRVGVLSDDLRYLVAETQTKAMR